MSSAEAPVAARPARVRPGGFRDGWWWLGLVTVARMYLVVLATLAGFALVPAIVGWQGSVVLSGSMEPHIRPGDVVLTSTPPDDAAIPVGRIIQFLAPAAAASDGNGHHLHRVVEVNEDGSYTTAGDANADVDSQPVNPGQVSGEARLIVRFVGLPQNWLSTGNMAALALWSVLTLAALAALFFDRPPRDPGQPPTQQQAAAKPTRRVFFALAGTSALSLLVAMPRPGIAAAFTARTTMTGNSWQVAVTPPLTLGRASGYALLAATSISNSESPGNPTEITGSIGTGLGAGVYGLNSRNVSGSIDQNTVSVRNARADALVLYNTLGSRPVTVSRPSALTGTLGPGVYAPTSGGFTLSGTLTLDARNDSSAVFVLKASSFSAASSSVVRLVNGASANNVYWRITGTVSLGNNSTSVGNYLTSANAAMQNKAQLTGRLISLTGSITTTSATVALPR